MFRFYFYVVASYQQKILSKLRYDFSQVDLFKRQVLGSPSYLPPQSGPYFFQSPSSYLPPPPSLGIFSSPVSSYLPPGPVKTAKLTSTKAPKSVVPRLSKPRRGYTKFFNFDLGSQHLEKRKQDRLSDGSFTVKQFVHLGKDDKEKVGKTSPLTFNPLDQKFANILKQNKENEDDLGPLPVFLMSTDLNPPGLRKNKSNQTQGHKDSDVKIQPRGQLEPIALSGFNQGEIKDLIKLIEKIDSSKFETDQMRDNIYRGDITPEAVKFQHKANIVNDVKGNTSFDPENIDRSDIEHGEVEDFRPLVDIEDEGKKFDYNSHPEAKLGELEFELHPEEKLGESIIGDL